MLASPNIKTYGDFSLFLVQSNRLGEDEIKRYFDQFSKISLIALENYINGTKQIHGDLFWFFR